MTQTEEEPKDFREAQIKDISQMTEPEKKDLVSYYLGQLANYYNDGARHLGVDANPLLRPLKTQLYRKEQEVLALRMYVVQVLESRIVQKMLTQLHQAERVHRSAEQIEDRRKDLEILETIERGLGILAKRWEEKFPRQHKLIKAMEALTNVITGGLADAER